MDIEKELKEIALTKKGNNEMALFYFGDVHGDGKGDGDGEWEFFLGNPSWAVRLGEVDGEFVTDGESVEEVISKMKLLISKD